jgi:nicotinamidase-related amidase
MTHSNGTSPSSDAAALDPLAALFAYRQAMNEFTLDPRSTALLIVDLQYGSTHLDYGWLPLYCAAGYQDVAETYARRIDEVVLPNVQRLQATFRDAGAPVVFLNVGTISGTVGDMPPRFKRAAAYWLDRQLTPPYASLGSRDIAIRDEIAPRPGEQVITKTGASGFTASPLERVLWNLGARELVVCGVATNYCVESTFRDASDRGLDCVLVDDACAATSMDIHRLGVESMKPFGRVTTTASLLVELAPAFQLRTSPESAPSRDRATPLGTSAESFRR